MIEAPARPVRAGERLSVRRAVALTRRVTAAEFGGARDVHACVHPAAVTPIGRPVVVNPPAGGMKFAGPYYLLPEIGRAPAEFPRETVAPELTLTRLSEVLCLPGQIALHRPDAGGPPVLLMESLTNEWHPHGVYLDKIDGDRFALKEEMGEATRLPGRYLYLDNMHSPHFGHFLTDVMAMVWGYAATGALGIGGLKVLIERHEAAYVLPLLEACGVPRDAIVRVTRPVLCEEVLFATRSFFVQGYTTPVAAATWAKIRDALDEGAGPEKVYVSRSRVNNRRLRSEAEVEAVFRRRGFFVAHPQEMTIGQQVTMWANARVVAGTAGSNMFGLAFQRRLRRGMIINSPNMVQFQEMFLQAGQRSESSFYLGEALGGEVHAPWQVAAGDLARHVDAWLQEAAPKPADIVTKIREPVRRKADYLALFDEAFYLRRYSDVRVGVRQGGFPNGRHHYEASGFGEGRQGFGFDEVWYAASYPDVVREIARGNFLDCAHHYAAIGHLAGCEAMAVAVTVTVDDAADVALFSDFVSLGDNCEFGIVQRAVGFEPLDLLRFGGPGLAHVNEAGLMLALRERFAAFGTADDVHIGQHLGEWIVTSRRYDVSFHTSRHSHEVDEATVFTDEARKLRFLAEKLVRDLETAEKIFVRKSNLTVGIETMFAFYRAMRDYGAPTLLWVCLADKETPHGTVERLAPGFWRGYIRRFAPREDATEVCVADWRELCQAVLGAGVARR